MRAIATGIARSITGIALITTGRRKAMIMRNVSKTDGTSDPQKMMKYTILGWMSEYPIEWIEGAYKQTMGAFKDSPLSFCEFVSELRRLDDGNEDKRNHHR